MPRTGEVKKIILKIHPKEVTALNVLKENKMKNTLSDFFSGIKGTLLSLLIGAILYIGFLLLRGSETSASFAGKGGAASLAVRHITTPIRRMMGWLCDFLPFSVMETLILLAAFLAVIILIRSIFLLIRRHGKTEKAIVLTRTIGFFLAAALLIWDGYCWLWGLDYYKPGFSELSGLSDRPVSAEELSAATAHYAAEANRLSLLVSRDENGLFNESLTDILEQSDEIYAGLADVYPFLNAPHRTPKAMRFSGLMSRIGYTGVYFPFTSETNINIDAPLALIPSTIAHELAHQRGIAPEQDANFVAVRACMTSGKNAYAYSGALLAYIHLGNALYEADRAAWETVYNSLSAEVKADLAENNRYWEAFRGTGQETADKIYEAFLSSYGQTFGTKSYGACVDLLTVDYLNQAQEKASAFLSEVDGIS